MKKRIGCTVLSFLIASTISCAAGAKPEVLKRIPVNSTEGVLTQSGVSFDSVNSSDGNGSLKIDTSQPVTVRLYEVRNVDIENARLIFKARLKTANVTGQAYLDMWCVFPRLGEFFSRGMQSALSGTVDWTTQEIPFFLQKGQKPELIKLSAHDDCARRIRRSWARLIKKVWEADPLSSPRCGRPMKIISLSDTPSVIERILRHLKLWDRPERPPPAAASSALHYEMDALASRSYDESG